VSNKRKHDLILIPIDKFYTKKGTGDVETDQKHSDKDAIHVLPFNFLGSEFDHIHISFPSVFSDDIPNFESTARNPKSTHPFLYFSVLITIYAGLSLEKARNKRRLQIERDIELEFDIHMSVTPSGDNYGSFSTPWSGDLEKYDI
jgi:hypothetical protein